MRPPPLAGGTRQHPAVRCARHPWPLTAVPLDAAVGVAPPALPGRMLPVHCAPAHAPPTLPSSAPLSTASRLSLAAIIVRDKDGVVHEFTDAQNMERVVTEHWADQAKSPPPPNIATRLSIRLQAILHHVLSSMGVRFFGLSAVSLRKIRHRLGGKSHCGLKSTAG